MSKKKLEGIFENGYGIIPKKFMKMEFGNIIGKEKGQKVKLIICYLLSYSGAGNSAFPGLNTIARDLEMSKMTVVAALKNAESLGLITIKKGNRKKSNTYILEFLPTKMEE